MESETSFREACVTMVLTWIEEKVRIWYHRPEFVTVQYWTPAERTYLRTLICDWEWLDRERAKGAVHKALIATGRQCLLEEHFGQGDYPDHVASQGAFAYALAHGGFTDDEIARISFDHDTVEGFVKKYDVLTPDQVLDELMSKERLSSVMDDPCVRAGHAPA